MKVLMSGNEAIARGAYECGVTFAAAYPGTPSTEITEEFSKYEGVYAEWSPNEKVALEVAIGASLAGANAMAVMKHVGVNVAADPLFTVSYTGTNGGLVIVTADDPSLHSSQNEQDNRNYSKFAKIPMIEPSDSAEAKDFIRIAFEIARKFDTPVFLRTTTRLSHSKSVVETGEPKPSGAVLEIRHDPRKYVMVPANARLRRLAVEERMKKLADFAETFPENRIEMNDPSMGIVAAGMAYSYAREAFPEASFLKLGMVHPIPAGMIRAFAAKVDRLYVVEELDPFLEEQIRALGLPVAGKEHLPFTNEFDPGIVETALSGKAANVKALPQVTIPPRPPNLCPGCPHRGLFYVLGKTKTFVAGDIGCYTLSFMKPLAGLHSCICMGASVGMAHGMSKALGEGGHGKVVGVIGDSTFIHSGITSLLNTVYNQSDVVIVICDNRTTAMTGMQQHPATGYTLQGARTRQLDIPSLGTVLGIENVRVINPLDLKETREVMKEELERKGPSLVVAQSPCALLLKKKGGGEKPLRIDPDVCTGCKVCLGLGCPAISWRKFDAETEKTFKKKTKKQEGIAVIDRDLCNGCTLCSQVCKFKAVEEAK